jgi:hemoglobin-like flavoprotein
VKFVLTNQLDLNAQQELIIRKTWEEMAQNIQGNGLQIFLRIFEICPEVKKLFQVDNVRHSELARNIVIKSHGVRFMNAIGAAVDNLADFGHKEDKLSQLLYVLGQQHKRYKGFVPEYFDVFYEALMWQWERFLGSRFTPEVSDTWSRVFVFIMEKLKEGYYSDEDKNGNDVRKVN